MAIVAVVDDLQRQVGDEGRPFAFARAFSGDRSAVHFDDGLDDRQAQAEAGGFLRRVGLLDAIAAIQIARNSGWRSAYYADCDEDESVFGIAIRM